MPNFTDHEGAVLADNKPKLDKPKKFKVILHNDDYTTMDFVVFILQHVFLRNEAEAVKIMFAVHQQGRGIAGVYPYEIAKTKCDKALNLSKAHEYPLLCTIEEE